MKRAPSSRLAAGLLAGLLPLLAPCAEGDYDIAVEQTDAEDAAVAGVPAPRRVPRWIDPEDGTRLLAETTFENDLGNVSVLLAGPVPSVNTNPFFQHLGTNGRACVTCHQPQDGMSLSVDTVRWMWRATRGTDPMFAAVDGRNCPHLPPGVPAAHSLMLDRGLIRVFLPWPPKGADGKAVTPEFSLEVVRDPTGCNTHPEHGMTSPKAQVSVYRRPRPAANLPGAVRANLMADGRAPTLAAQAADAVAGHMEGRAALPAEVLQAIVDFESGIFVAQVFDRRAGMLVDADGTAPFGPRALQKGLAGLTSRPAAGGFPLPVRWQPESGELTRARQAARESIARGRELFIARRLAIGDAMPRRPGERRGAGGSCATCHGAPGTGLDVRDAFIDTGVATSAQPAGAAPDLPLFKVTCRREARAHPVLGREFYTQDPGRALITGRCRDVGALVTQQLRGLASRPPYFANGTAATLGDVVDHYDRRYGMRLTPAEKQDLVAFLGAL